MERIMLSLMFRREAEEAVKSYVSLFSPLFGDSKILAITYYGEDELEALRTLPEMTEDDMPGPAGSVKTSLCLTVNQAYKVARAAEIHKGISCEKT